MSVTQPADSALDADPAADQPGLSGLREAVANRLPSPPRRSTLGDDALAGLNSAVASAPDGLTSGLLAGVSSIHGRYAAMAGPTGGGLFSSTKLPVITTSASALTADQVLSGVPAESRVGALVALAEGPVVILRLRGRASVDATLVDVLAACAGKLKEAGGRLYLAGLGDEVYDQVARTGKLGTEEGVRAQKATRIVGEATRRALADAEAWLAGRSTADGAG